CPDIYAAKDAILKEKQALIEDANAAYPSMVARGGGAEDLEVRILNEESGSAFSQMLVLHLYVNTFDAMGANIINTMEESLAPIVEQQSDEKVYLRILFTYTERSIALLSCVILL